MNYFDMRTSKALMESRLREAGKATQRSPVHVRIPAALRERLGAWMIARGEKLVSSEPKIA